MDIFIPIFVFFTIFVLCSLCGFCCKKQNEGAIYSSKKNHPTTANESSLGNFYRLSQILMKICSIFSARRNHFANSPASGLSDRLPSQRYAYLPDNSRVFTTHADA